MGSPTQGWLLLMNEWQTACMELLQKRPFQSPMLQMLSLWALAVLGVMLHHGLARWVCAKGQTLW